MADAEQIDYTSLTVQLLSAYVANNIVASADLASLIQSTRAALVAETVAPVEAVTEYVPAVSIRKSIASREHILSLIDGRPYKTLKRHLSTHGLTPAEYRARYGLPENYPIVAQAYSDQRRAVAQKLGLGQRGTQARVAAAQAAGSPPVQTPPDEVKATKPKTSVNRPTKKSAVSAAQAGETAAVEPAATMTQRPAGKKGADKPKSEVRSNAPTAQPASATAADAKPVKAKSTGKAATRSTAPRRKLGIKAD